MITYRATLDVSRELAMFVAQLLAHERRVHGTRKHTRVLTCFWQAVLGLRWFRDGVGAPALARDLGMSRAAGYRYRDEVVTVLAEHAPTPHEALEQAKANGLAYVVLDGKVFATDRCAEKTTGATGKQIDAWYSGKAHTHGGNIQALSAPNGLPLRVSEVARGSTRDLTAARGHVPGPGRNLDVATIPDPLTRLLCS